MNSSRVISFSPVIFIIVFMVIVAIVTIIIASAIKGHKSISTTIETMGKEIYKKSLNNLDNKPVIEKVEKTTYCDYCGSMLEDGATKCHACGAKRSKK